MEFDKSKVYTSLNADELKVGSIVYVSDSLAGLKGLVINEPKALLYKIKTIWSENETMRLCVEDGCDWSLAYLISEPEEEAKVESLSIWYVTFNIQGFVKQNVEPEEQVLYCGSEEDCTSFIDRNRDKQNAIKAYARGETIQIFMNGKWCDFNKSTSVLPDISNYLFRETGKSYLCWEDLKLGDKVRSRIHPSLSLFVTGYDGNLNRIPN